MHLDVNSSDIIDFLFLPVFLSSRCILGQPSRYVPPCLFTPSEIQLTFVPPCTCQEKKPLITLLLCLLVTLRDPPRSMVGWVHRLSMYTWINLFQFLFLKWQPSQCFKVSWVADSSGKQQVWTVRVWKNIETTDQSRCRQEPSIRVVAIKVSATVLSSEEQRDGDVSGAGWKKNVSFAGCQGKGGSETWGTVGSANQTANAQTWASL